jgi:hypothetical protein
VFSDYLGLVEDTVLNGGVKVFQDIQLEVICVVSDLFCQVLFGPFRVEGVIRFEGWRFERRSFWSSDCSAPDGDLYLICPLFCENDFGASRRPRLWSWIPELGGLTPHCSR